MDSILSRLALSQLAIHELLEPLRGQQQDLCVAVQSLAKGTNVTKQYEVLQCIANNTLCKGMWNFITPNIPKMIEKNTPDVLCAAHVFLSPGHSNTPEIKAWVSQCEEQWKTRLSARAHGGVMGVTYMLRPFTQWIVSLDKADREKNEPVSKWLRDEAKNRTLTRDVSLGYFKVLATPANLLSHRRCMYVFAIVAAAEERVNEHLNSVYNDPLLWKTSTVVPGKCTLVRFYVSAFNRTRDDITELTEKAKRLVLVKFDKKINNTTNWFDKDIAMTRHSLYAKEVPATTRTLFDVSVHSWDTSPLAGLEYTEGEMIASLCKPTKKITSTANWEASGMSPLMQKVGAAPCYMKCTDTTTPDKLHLRIVFQKRWKPATRAIELWLEDEKLNRGGNTMEMFEAMYTRTHETGLGVLADFTSMTKGTLTVKLVADEKQALKILGRILSGVGSARIFEFQQDKKKEETL
jgi:hypothetical protein